MNFLSFVLAALELVAPSPDRPLALMPDCQRSVVTNETRTARAAALKALGPKARDWRRSRPVTFAWRATAGEKGPWEVAFGTAEDFSNARRDWVKLEPDTTGLFTYAPARANFEIATRYHWQITNGKAKSAGTFVTEDLAPRWIAIEGRVGNFRDLGGRRTADGRRVRQGRIYRSQGLNDNSVTGKDRGRNRLMVEDIAYLTETLGIRTDLDLRSGRETANMTVSPLGESVRFIHQSSYAYDGIFQPAGKKIMAKNFRVFCGEANYPILFHCIGGADRTGAVAYVLNGVLGVSRRELETDWESTFYPRIPYKEKDGKVPGISEEHFNVGFAKYGAEGDSWNRRIELYLLDCGVTQEEIEKFRTLMLQSDEAKNKPHNHFSYNGWRWGLPPMYYPTHSNGFYTCVTHKRFTEVTCSGIPSLCFPYRAEAKNEYGNPYGSEYAMYRCEDGSYARMLVSWDVPAFGAEAGRIWGQKGCFVGEKGGYRGWFDKEVKADPERYLKPRLAPQITNYGGHGASHAYLTDDFLRGLLVPGHKVCVDLRTALDTTIAGVYAHMSAMKNGEHLTIPSAI